MQCLCAGLPATRDDLCDGESVAGVLDRGGEDFVEWQLAKAVVQLGPAVDASGHRHGERSSGGDVFQVAMLELFECEAARAAAAGVEAVELLCVGVPDNGEQVAAEAAAHGFGYAEDGGRRD